MSGRRSVHIVVTGLVQGVGFRAWTNHKAGLNGLDGWVRNRRDGSVEAVLSGPADRVDAMLESCRKGPRGARVDDLVITDRAEEPSAGSGFGLRDTA